MARTRTLTLLIADVRNRANMENSTFVSDAEITEWLNQELAELHALLTTAEGHPHYRSSQSIDVEAGTALYGLESDFYRVLEVIATIDGRSTTLQPFMPSERASLLNSSTYAYESRGAAPMYRIQANNIEFLPSTRSYTATVYYTPTSPRLVSGGDTVDGFDGYEMVAINGATSTCLEKENPGSGAFYAALKDRAIKVMQAVAPNRDASHPERVQDVIGDVSDCYNDIWLRR